MAPTAFRAGIGNGVMMNRAPLITDTKALIEAATPGPARRRSASASGDSRSLSNSREMKWRVSSRRRVCPVPARC